MRHTELTFPKLFASHIHIMPLSRLFLKPFLKSLKTCRWWFLICAFGSQFDKNEFDVGMK